MCRSWIFATPDYTDKYSYILVHTRTYLYILVHTRTYYHTTQCTSNQAGFALRWRTVAAARLCHALLTASFLSVVSSMVRPPRRGLPSPNCHSHGLTSQLLLPSYQSVAAASAQPYGKPESLCLLIMWGIVGVKLPARNNGIRGTLPTIFWTSAT